MTDQMTTERQRQWAEAAERAKHPVTAGLFTLLSLPNEQERGHSCSGHHVTFSRDGRRGIKCGICGTVVKWVST